MNRADILNQIKCLESCDLLLTKTAELRILERMRHEKGWAEARIVEEQSSLDKWLTAAL